MTIKCLEKQGRRRKKLFLSREQKIPLRLMDEVIEYGGTEGKAGVKEHGKKSVREGKKEGRGRNCYISPSNAGGESGRHWSALCIKE